MENATLEQKTQTLSLHNHTSASDGTWTPEDLARTAAEAGIEVIALTDHDTFENVPRFLDACKQYGIIGIAGAEFDTCENGIEILSYFPKGEIPKPVQELAQKSTRERILFIERLLKNMNDFTGQQYTMEDISRGLGRKAFTKHDVYRAFVPALFLQSGNGDLTEGEIISWVDRETSDNESLLYTKKKLSPTPKEVIRIVKENGGYTSLAHPARMRKVVFPWSEKREGKPYETIIQELAQAGLDAVEWYGYKDKHIPGLATQKYSRELENMHRAIANITIQETAREQGLETTYGNDSHHPSDGLLTNPDIQWKAQIPERLRG